MVHVAPTMWLHITLNTEVLHLEAGVVQFPGMAGLRCLLTAGVAVSVLRRMGDKFHQLLAVGRWFPPGTPVSSTRKLISSSSFHRLDMTLAVAEALNPNNPN